MNKWALQIATAILGIVPIATGLIGMSGISDPIYASIGLPANPLLDSNLRFFGGVWFGLGLALYWLIPKIEKQTVLFRAIWGMIFVGGIGRLISMLLIGLPSVPFIGFTILEIVGAPIFVAWQARIAKLN
jgi:predicted membrane channel-forming protein YqfA (hemolysin III family)